MAQASSSAPGIFISYRRGDSGGYARALYERLSARFGDEHVFMDVGHIQPGADFKQVIENAIGSCKVLIVLIGQNWAGGQAGGARRLDDPEDFVRLEVAAALAHGVHVIPVLVQGAPVPRPQELPADLVPLSGRHAHELSDSRWDHDVDRLVAALEKVVVGARIPPPKVRPWIVFAAATLACVLIGGIILAVSWRRVEPPDSGGTKNGGPAPSSPTPSPGLAPQAPSANASSQPADQPGTMALPPPGQQQPPVQQPAAASPSDNIAHIDFVLVQEGSFKMGSDSERAGANEKFVHTENVKNFYLGKYEVSLAQWRAVMGDSLQRPGDCGDCPIVKVSWREARRFIEGLNARSAHFKYRLPTEAEWEYACRAGSTADNAPELGTAEFGMESGGAKPVRTGTQNAWGLHNMRGNVWEWCEDNYRESYADMPNASQQRFRVIRGGAWNSPEFSIRPSSRGFRAPDERGEFIGFRVAADAK